MDEETILGGLNPEQQEAVRAADGPVLILAGAGSGKTRVLVHRIAYLIDSCGVNPGNILAITFTNKAADEMRARVDKMIGFGSENIWVSTFHSLCVRILRRNADLLGFTRFFSIYDRDDQLSVVRQILKEKNISKDVIRDRGVLAAISSAKDELIMPEKYAAQNTDFYGGKAAEVYRAYQKKLLENNAMDFDDLLVMTVRLFEEHPEVLETCQSRFRYIMVDEYQDTNTAQFRLISLLAAKYRNLCVVGDDDQSIYRFRGANIRNILDFEKVFPDAHVVKLERNYRSTQNILDAANGIIRNNHGRKDKKLWTENGSGGKIRFRVFPTAYDEADFVARDISGMVRSGRYSWKDCAVLYRTNAQSRIFEEKFLMANIPYQIVGGVNFYSRKEIKDLLAYLKTIDNAVDEVAVRRIINIPKRGIGSTTIAKVGAYAEAGGISFFDGVCEAGRIPGMGAAARRKLEGFGEFIVKMRERAGDIPVSSLIREVLSETGYQDELEKEGTEEAESRIGNLEELVSKAVQYEENAEEATLSGFLEEVALIADIDSVDENEDRVLLMTLHAAKGLEFPAVYMTGMEDGVFPGGKAVFSDRPEEDLEEERRLAYVGVTRAKETLTLTSARERMINGETRDNPVSRFVREIPRELLDTGSRPSGGRSVLPGNRSVPDSGKMPFGKSIDDLPWAGNAAGKSADRGAGSTSRRKAAPLQPYDNPYIHKQDTENGLGYEVGDTVRHVKFGSGTVQAIEPGSRDYLVTVDFPGWGVKKMYAAFAKLKRE